MGGGKKENRLDYLRGNSPGIGWASVYDKGQFKETTPVSPEGVDELVQDDDDDFSPRP